MIKSKALLLAGVSALAMLACAAEANAEDFSTPGLFSFIAPVSGEYALDVLGASGGDGLFGGGGLGAEVTGDVLLKAGQDLTLYVGGRGQSLAGAGSVTGGGGGGSFVFLGTNVLAVAGGGGGASYASVIGGPGLAGTSGGAGGGVGGGAAGASGNGGGGGTNMFAGAIGLNGAGGAGVNSGAMGYGGDGAASGSGYGGRFPNGGVGSYGAGNAGGFGGGGGGGDEGGGGGSGFSGGGGGSGSGFIGYGGGGGGSYLSSLVTNQVLTAGVRSGDGSISIDPLSGAVPEPSTWVMTLAGFAGLGWLASRRRRKPSAA